MDNKLKGLSPNALWGNFSDICNVPRPSGSEDAIEQFIIDFAKRNNLEHSIDKAGNIIVRKSATEGMENVTPIVLQSHLDMVPQKNGDKKFDFTKDAIEAYIDGDWVTANGTTLGADNGIGVAATMAVLESKDIAHGPIEGLFTATEETGMFGAFGLNEGVLKGEILLNLDSETEGELYVGCAGGLNANITLKYKKEETSKKTKGVQINIKGLRGGHSGLEIILQRANANKLLFRFLHDQTKVDGVYLSTVDGGSLRNAIPRECVAVVAVEQGRLAKFMEDVVAFEKMVIKEFDTIEDELSFKATSTKTPTTVVAKRSQNAIIRSICGCPNGIIKMSTSMTGMVQTSTNLARVVVDNGTMQVQILMRSSSNTEKEDLAGNLSSVFKLAGAKVELSGGYDGWNPNMASPILKTMKDSYKTMYGEEASVTAIHAGLECGVIGGKYPNMDMISFGPTICYPHSPDEKVNIASVGKFWDFLCYTLANAPKK